MSTKKQTMIGIINYYKEKTGNSEIDMKEVATMAIRMGWKVPPPISQVDRLARELTQVWREVIRHDGRTGKPYRAHHAIVSKPGPHQTYLWIDIDDPETTRPKMHKSLMHRREQMVGDGLQLTLDADHWNSIHPEVKPIQIPLDFTDDVEWRKNAPDETKKAG